MNGRNRYKATLTNAVMYTENDQCGVKQFYLDLTYVVETDKDIREVHIPKVKLPINAPGIELCEYRHVPCYSYELVLPGTRLNVEKVDHEGGLPYAYTEKVIKKKYTKMTLSEIEKKLDLNIELIAEKEKENDKNQ